MAVLLTQLIVAGGLTALSVQGARNARALAGRQLELVEQSGAKVLQAGPDAEHGAESAEHLATGPRPELNGLKQDLPSMLANKGSRLVHTPRDQALHELLDEAEKANIIIHSDDEAQRLLDWAARTEGVDPASYHAVTIGDDIFVRAEHVGNVRVLREELIHVFQQRGGIASNELVEAEVQARLSMIRFRHRWGITSDEVREMIREIRTIRKTGKY